MKAAGPHMKRQPYFKSISIIVFIFCSSVLVWAEKSDSTQSSNKKEDPKAKHSLTFEDELIEGSTAKPELFFLFQKKNFNYGKLIKLRENFVPEMRRSTDDIQRGRSTN